MIKTIDLSSPETAIDRLGVAALTRAAFSGADLGPVSDVLHATLVEDPINASALMDLSVIEQLKGNLEGGLTLQETALEHAQVFKTLSTTDASEIAPKTIKLLALAAPIHMGGNTPIDFLIEQSHISLETLYIAPGLPLPNPLPEHDLAFVVAPGDSDDSRRFLAEINRQNNLYVIVNP